MMYAQTQNSFEEIALKFIKLDGKDALKSFIQKKLSALRHQVTFINFAKLTISDLVLFFLKLLAF